MAVTRIKISQFANGVDGELITWDASGVPATVAVGTSGQVLTSNGVGAAPTFQTIAGGGSSSGIAGAVQISGGSGAFSSDATNFFFNTTSKQLNIAGNTSYGVTIGGTGNGYDASPAGAVTGAFAALRSNVDATGNVNLSINNLNTTGSANARISATTSAGGGDPFLQLSTAEVGYIIGVDNDGSDKLFMGLGSNPSSMTTTNITLSGVAMGVMQTSPTAKLHLGAGTTGATTAPLKFTSGVNMTTPEAGAVEWDGTNLFITQTTGPTRKTIAYTDSAITGNINMSQLVSGTFSNNGSGGLTGTLATSDFMQFNYNGGATGFILNDLANSAVIYSKDTTQSVSVDNVQVRITSGTSRMDYVDGTLRLYDSDATQFIGFQTPATGSLTTSYTLTFPADNGTIPNTALLTDASGNLSWSTDPIGNVIGVASSADSEIALFNGTGGKTIKRATGTGVAIVTSGVLSTKTNPTGAFVGESDTQTLSAKRIDPRVTSTTSSATPTPNVANEDVYILTALAVNATFGSPAGPPVQSTKLLIRVKDNATPRTLAWNAIYRAVGVTLPTTTTANKTLYVGCVYNSTDTKWDVIAVTQEV